MTISAAQPAPRTRSLKSALQPTAVSLRSYHEHSVLELTIMLICEQ